MPFVFCSENTRVYIDNIKHGFLPHSGQSYWLNSLPFELGKFLSLTGTPLGAHELQYFGFARKVIEFDSEDFEKIRKFSHSEPFFVSLNDNKDTFYKYQISRRRDAELNTNEFIQRSQTENPKDVLFDIYYRKVSKEKSEENY